MSEMQRSQLKTGQRPIQPAVRTYKPGDVLFEEGTQGKELFVIKEGKVAVYKNTPEGQIELAQVEEGGLIGEMSLLDNLPRSATVKATKETKAMIINPVTFQATMQEVPVWLSSIIKIVVSRLRDANKRVDLPILRDRERGVVSLLLLLLPTCRYEYNSCTALDYDMVLAEIYYICRLKKKEIVGLLLGLKRRGILEIVEATVNKKHICIKDLEVLRIFEEYLILKSQKRTFRETEISDEALGVLNNIAYVAQKSGIETEEGTSLLKSSLVADLADRRTDRLEMVLVDLKRKNLINMLPSDKDVQIIFRKEALTRIKKIKEWLPRFDSTDGGNG